MSSALRTLLKPAKATPNVSFGPFRMLEVLPWLMLASSMRFAAYASPGIVALLLLVVESFALFLAFILATRRMIEFADGRTSLGHLSFAEQFKLARAVIGRVAVLLASAVAAALAIGQPQLASHLLMGFDGIAFDQFSKIGIIWSSLLACIVLLMVVRADAEGQPKLFKTLGEFVQRAGWLVPAVLAVILIQYGLTFVQGILRWGVYYYFLNPYAPDLAKNAFYFFFVFGFATIRLWLTLAVLTFALRASYRQGGG